MKHLIICLALLMPVAACAPGVNSTGTATTVGQQVSAGSYTAYIAASGAWLAYLTAGPPVPAVIAAVEPKRKAARSAIDAAAAMPNDPTMQALAATAMAQFTAALASVDIKVK
jgi:hypothetical protein